MVEALNGSIQELPVNTFAKNANELKRELSDKLNNILHQIDSGDYQGEINKLNNDIKPNMDGCIGGGSNDDWIINFSSQEELTKFINQIISELDKIIKIC